MRFGDPGEQSFSNVNVLVLSMIRYIGYFFRFLARFYLLPIYWLSGFVPRRRDLWVFGSWGGYRFADNAAAFFMHCQRTVGDDIELVWISRKPSIVRDLRDRNLKAHWIWSPKGIATCLRAGIHFCDSYPKDTNFWLGRGAERINLWSGVPLKVIQRDHDNPRNRHYRLFHGFWLERWFLSMMMPWHVLRPDMIIATSIECGEITKRAFALEPGKVPVTGFPRNDVLFHPDQSVSGPDASLPKLLSNAIESGRKVILYLPTFRDSGKSYMNMDWDRLDDLMERLGATFFVKTHPADRLKNDIDCVNVHQLPQLIDVYDLLPRTDILISDYSSIIFDYMLLERPIIYYTPDLDEFVDSSRALNFHPREVAVGPMCESFEELLAAIDRIIHGGIAGYEARFEEVFPRLHQFRDGESSQRILEVLSERYFDGKLVPRGSGEIPSV
jgi:CDP-glycerol glycerophosphotransferase (TagB/SpsB family)